MGPHLVLLQGPLQQDASADAGEGGAEQQCADRPQHGQLQGAAEGCESASCTAPHQWCTVNVASYSFWQTARGPTGGLGRTLVMSR